MKDVAFTAIIEPDEGGYHAYAPALPGCHTFGTTIEEARINLLEAVELHIEAMQRHGETVPVEREPVLVTRLSVPLAS
ncbi:MAG: type II toxin-antitoxin system HicB family antitoxin [Tepidiformaceae bacterium]